MKIWKATDRNTTGRNRTEQNGTGLNGTVLNGTGRRKFGTRAVSILTAAALVLTLAACGGKGGSSGSGKPAAQGGEAQQEAASAADCVYSAEQLMLIDDEGLLTDLNVDGLAYRNARLYATAFSFGEWDMGTHLLMNFNPDASDLQYSMLMSGGMEDIISIHIGQDGNYYLARVSYDGDSLVFSQEGSTQAESAAAVEPEGPGGPESEGPESEGPESEGPESEGPESEGPAGPDEGPGESAMEGPTAEYAEEYGPDIEFENMEEFFTEGGDSPANDPALSDEATNGITSPQDEYNADSYEGDGEAELTISEVEEIDGSFMDEQEAVYLLTCMTADGQELWTAPAKIPEGGELDYYINGIVCCDEGVLVSGAAGLDLYSKEDGSFIRTVSTDQQLQGATPYVLEDGTVVVLLFGSGGEEVDVVNLQDGTLSGHYAIPSEVGMSAVFPGKTYALYLSGTNAVYGMNLDGSPAVKVLDYIDSDMDITALTCLAEMDDGRFAAVVSDLEGTGAVEILTKVDPEIVANRKTLSIGCYYLDYEVRKQVFDFNKKSRDVRFSIVDYSKYDSETGGEGMQKLNTDIASGMAPDILILSSVMPVRSYIAKGVFEDLTPYFDNDEEIKGEQYLTNVLDAFKTDGKMYAVVPSFFVNTIAAKTADIGDGSDFTPDFVDKLAKERSVTPEKMFGICTRDDLLYQAMEMCGGQFIDWENASCSFNSPEFIRLLQFIAQFPAKIDDTHEEDTSADYRSGKSLFARVSLGAFDDYANLKYGAFGEDVTLAGFPSVKPGKAVVYPQLEIAINSSSVDKDACWSFVRRFLLDDYQKSVEMYWPVSIDALDRLANEAMKPIYYEDEFGNQVEDHIIVNIGGEDIALPRISDSEVDLMYAFLKGLESEAYYDASIENIVAEEAAAFFEGQKSAEDVAGVIQSRVQIYINENS